MKKLPNDFNFTRYGVEVRLAEVTDAEFILSIRTDTYHTRFIHATENNLEKQEEWLQKYKEREAAGKEYYFIYSQDGVPFGMNRVHNIFDYYGTEGSWLCKPKNDPKASMASYMILHDIMFEDLDLDLSIFDVRKDNKKVWKTHKAFGAIDIGESEIDYYFSIFRKDYIKCRDKYISFF